MGRPARASIHPLAVAAAVFGLAGVIGTMVFVRGAWLVPRTMPQQKIEWWWEAWINRWFWLTAGAAAVGAIGGEIAARRLAGLGGARGYLLARAAKAAGATSLGALVLAAMYLPAATRPHESARKIECLSNVKNIALAVEMYVTDYDQYPEGAAWSDTVGEYLKNRDVYRCHDAMGECAYAYNAALSGRRADALAAPDEVVAVFESDRGWNAHGGSELMTDFPRHMGGENVGFADGHARWCARKKPAGELRPETKWPREYERKSKLQWQPVVEKGAR